MTPSFSISNVEVRKRTLPTRDARGLARAWQWRQYEAAPRVYVWGDYEKQSEVRAIAEAMVQAYVPGATVRWSRKAGCSCGCSPAFIVKAPPSVLYFPDFGALNRADLHVEVASIANTAEVAA